MNLEEILKQVEEISAHPPDPNEEGNLCYGLTWSLKNEVCRIARTLVERVQEAEDILKHVSSCGMNDCDCMEAPLYDYMEKYK